MILKLIRNHAMKSPLVNQLVFKSFAPRARTRESRIPESENASTPALPSARKRTPLLLLVDIITGAVAARSEYSKYSQLLYSLAVVASAFIACFCSSNHSFTSSTVMPPSSFTTLTRQFACGPPQHAWLLKLQSQVPDSIDAKSNNSAHTHTTNRPDHKKLS